MLRACSGRLIGVRCVLIGIVAAVFVQFVLVKEMEWVSEVVWCVPIDYGWYTFI